MTKEARMTKLEPTVLSADFRHSGFVIVSAFVIPPSSFTRLLLVELASPGKVAGMSGPTSVKAALASKAAIPSIRDGLLSRFAH
jgi:hypothetical protein